MGEETNGLGVHLFSCCLQVAVQSSPAVETIHHTATNGALLHVAPGI